METVVKKRPSVAVLMTSFNRRATTLSCLEKLYAQTALPHIELSVILVDDASKDGTAGAVLAHYPEVEVVHGTGSLFWNRGMRLAFGRALKRSFDFYVWLNDDTQLFPTALQHMLDASEGLEVAGKRAVLTGSTCDPISGKRTYGGQRWKSTWKRELELVQPRTEGVVSCHTMNGNFTLIPRAVADKVGNLEGRFTHSFGDLDYGFRARRAGFAVYVVPGFIGTCSDNSRKGTWRDRRSSWRRRWQHLNSVKGSPFREWVLYCHRHLGLLWPLYAVSPYVKTLATSLRGNAG